MSISTDFNIYKSSRTNMIGTSMYTTILTLYKQGISQRKIARTTNVHRKAVKNIINRYEKSKIETPVPYNRPSMTDSWHEDIINLMSNKLSTVRIHEELKNKGYNLSYSSLSRYIRSHKIKIQLVLDFIQNLEKSLG